jgi:hypothetical protein
MNALQVTKGNTSMNHTITFIPRNGLVVCEVRTSPNPADLVAAVESGQINADDDPTELAASFEWLPHQAEAARKALDYAISKAKTQELE